MIMEEIVSKDIPSFSVYDASAGSGKTYTLVKEYLKIILSSPRNDSYRNILAITFTNKAVHEMKSRIVYNLHQFSRPETSEKSKQLLEQLSKETNKSTLELKEKARKIIKHLVHNYASFDILTIDKFTHKVIRAFAYDLDLPITFEVVLDTDSLLIEAVESIVSQAGQSESITNLLVDFAFEKTDSDKSWDITREIFEVSKLLYSENNREQIDELHKNEIEDFIEAKKKIQDSKEHLEQININIGNAALELLSNSNINLSSFSRGTFPNHLRSISLGNFKESNKKFETVDSVQLNKSATDVSEINLLLPKIVVLLNEAYQNFERIAFYKAVLKNITPLSLLNTISAELTVIQKEQNLLSIAEFNSLIYHHIQNQPAPFIYERIGEKYHHFFIDEFQDTSEMQWQNLVPLIDNALSSEFGPENKGTLMIVGDPKQSIYRWRGGKAEQFIELSNCNNPFHNKDKKVFELDTNYRSYSEVITFNNSFFRFLSGEFEDPNYKNLYQNHSQQLCTDKQGGYVGITFLASKSEEDIDLNEEELDRKTMYCKASLDRIKESLQQGFSYKQIAILTRKKIQGVELANYLSQHSIPIISSETLLIDNSPEVKFIVSVLEYLHNQNNRESKANMLYYLSCKLNHSFEKHDFIAAGMKLEKEVQFEAWLHEFDISIKWTELRRKSLYEAVELLIGVLVDSKYRDAYLQCFLDLILERDYHKQAGISDFLSYWKENSNKHSVPLPEETDAVRILTVHKSKGLEFPVVIFPFAEEEYEKSPKERIWIKNTNDDYGLSRVLIDNSRSVENFGEHASVEYKKQKQEELLDNINILYVALTRAEEQLHIISTEIQPRKDGTFPNNMASFFVKYLESINIYDKNKTHYSFGKVDRLSIDHSTPFNQNLIVEVLSKFDPKRIRIAQRDSGLWGTYQESAIEYGNLIHKILSWVVKESDLKSAIENAVEVGLIQRSQMGKVAKTISEIVSHKELSVFFSDAEKVYSEQVIINNEGSLLIPDRVVINSNNHAFILDYKTGLHQEKHRLQLENYQMVLEKMKFVVKAKTLVYIGEKIELVQL